VDKIIIKIFTIRKLMGRSVLSCKSIEKSYFDGDSKLSILKGVTLDLYQGEFLAIMGASGCGKSTLLNILGLIDAPSAGELWVDGDTIQTMSIANQNQTRNKKIGLVFQSYHLIPELNALENVMLPFYASNNSKIIKSICEKNAHHLLELVGLAKRKTHFPLQLSGGEQQRVAIARALLFTPPILLCDEPTGHLDQSTGKLIIELLVDLQKKFQVSMIIMTHDANIANVADKSLTLEGGIIL
jgi:ABC-type lipoprotein export system ATPase subunit